MTPDGEGAAMTRGGAGVAMTPDRAEASMRAARVIDAGMPFGTPGPSRVLRVPRV